MMKFIHDKMILVSMLPLMAFAYNNYEEKVIASDFVTGSAIEVRKPCESFG